ncbi:MAG TPA: DUF433 domain-containing protein [Gemmataceae bacterium]|jgi:uncharacterized protein (DUF433 family)|nr:DUF433 domain-containing protein [Gemmataceae bacterium]
MSAINGKVWKWLERDPKSSLKQLSIKGRRIRARTLYGLTLGEDAMTPEEVAADYNVPVEAVLEAIEYCETDPPEIREDFEEEERTIAANLARDADYYLTPQNAERKMRAKKLRGS